MFHSTPPKGHVTQEILIKQLAHALKSGDRNTLLQVYIECCKLSLREENYENALLNLWKCLSVMEFAKDRSLKLHTLDLCFALISFLHEYEDFQLLLETNLAIEHDESYDIISNTYFLLSMILLQRDEQEHAYSFAKMAYYYAKKLPEEQQMLYICNAQLQLTFIALITKRYDDFDHYIKSFDWQLENCQTKQEKTLIQTVHFTKKCLTTQFNLHLFDELKNRLSSSKVKFYPTYLAIVLQKIFSQHEEHQIQRHVNDWANELKKSSAFNLEKFKNNHKNVLTRNYLNTELYFEKAEKLFNKVTTEGNRIHLIHFKVVQNAQQMVEHLLLIDEHIEHILHLYFNNTVTIMFDEKFSPFFDEMFERYSSSHEILNKIVSENYHHRFLDLHNLEQIKKYTIY